MNIYTCRAIVVMSIAAVAACTSTNSAAFKLTERAGVEKQMEEPYSYKSGTSMLTNFVNSRVNWIVRSEAQVGEHSFRIFPVRKAKANGPIIGYALGLRIKYVEGTSQLSFRIMPTTAIAISRGIAQIETRWVGKKNNEELLCVFLVNGKEHTERIATIDYMGFKTHRVNVPKGKHIEFLAFEIKQANQISIDTWYYFYFTDILAIRSNNE